MKSKYELTISSNYVKDWTYLEAVREFFQNAIDESKSNPDHAMSYEYDPVGEELTITNKNSKLDVNTLLLGETSKSNGNYIGSFGEGYKIGILVLLREGKTVTIHNASDEWNTYMVNSRRYNSSIPCIEIDRNRNRGNTDLTVVIGNITPDEYDSLTDNNLVIKNDSTEVRRIHTDYGDLLDDESEKGRIYVGGLFVYSDFELKYGYDIDPKYVSLNRDRNMISRFDLIWNTSRIVCLALKDNPDDLFDTLDCKDTEYVDSFIDNSSKTDLIRYFKEHNGDRIPVSTQEEFNYFKSKGMNPIIVKERVKVIIGKSSYYDDYEEYDSHDSLYNKMIELMDQFSNHISDEGTDAYDRFYNLILGHQYDLSQIKCND